jgi:hypothetical protein
MSINQRRQSDLTVFFSSNLISVDAPDAPCGPPYSSTR